MSQSSRITATMYLALRWYGAAPNERLGPEPGEGTRWALEQRLLLGSDRVLTPAGVAMLAKLSQPTERRAG